MKLNIDKMGSISAASYLTAPEAVVLYRTIMRILYNEKELYNSQLSTEDIFVKLREYEEFSDLSIDKLKSALAQLTVWGSISPMQDPRRVKTIEEYQNKAYRYSLTEVSVIIERMTIEIENMFSEGNTLSSSLLIRINDCLCNINSVVSDKSSKDLNEWWRNLNEDFKRLNRNFSDYLHSFYSVEGERLIRSVDFLVHKDKFIEYLRDFITQLQKHSIKIENNLRRISPELKEKLLKRIVESEMNLPRTKSELLLKTDIEDKVNNQWNALYSWFVSENGKESQCNLAMEYTNEIIRKMINNAVLLMQLQNAGVSKKQEYRKYMEMFGKCQSIEEAHCLSAHAFGVMNVFHYKYNANRETDSIFENASELSPQIFEIKPVTRKYKPRVKSDGFENRAFEKSIKRQNKIAEINSERKMIEGYIKNNRISIADLKYEIVPEKFRITILKWIAFAGQNRNKTGITDFGRKYRMIPSNEMTVLHCIDGDLLMPAYTFEFEVESYG